MKKSILTLALKLVICVVVASLLFSAACDNGSPTEGIPDQQTQETEPATTETTPSTPAEPITYIVADPTGDWGYPSPYAHYSRGPGYTRMSFVFDTLIWKDEAGFISALAESWEYVETENAYVFNLQRNAKWHDGTGFTAEDVAFTIDYVKEHPSPFVTLIGPSGVSETEIIDNYTIKLYLEQPYAPFLNNVAGTQPILPKHIWEGVEKPEESTGPEAVVGTGPYKLADYSKEHGTYLYEAFDEYYQGKPAVDRLVFVKVSEEMVPAALKQGSINAGGIAPEAVDGVRADGFVIIGATYSWNAKMTINHKKSPLNDKRFRQALAYAIDRESLVEITQRGHGMAGSPGILSQDNEWFNPDIQMYEPNPDKAQQLLLELGYELDDGYFTRDGEDLKLELITQARFKAVGQFVKDELEEVGIRVDFLTLEGKTVDARVGNWDFDLSIYGHGGLYEPSILNKVIVGGGFNSARFQANETLNQLLAAQLREMDRGQREALVDQVQAVYADEVPALTLYYPKWYWAHDGGVELFYTQGGIASGVPIPLNKMAFMEYKGK